MVNPSKSVRIKSSKMHLGRKQTGIKKHIIQEVRARKRTKKMDRARKHTQKKKDRIKKHTIWARKRTREERDRAQKRTI